MPAASAAATSFVSWSFPPYRGQSDATAGDTAAVASTIRDATLPLHIRGLVPPLARSLTPLFAALIEAGRGCDSSRLPRASARKRGGEAPHASQKRASKRFLVRGEPNELLRV